MFTSEQVNGFLVRYEELVAGGMPIIDAFTAIESEHGNDAMWLTVDKLFQRGMEEGCKETRTMLLNAPKLLEWSELWAAMKKKFCGGLGDRGWAMDNWGDNQWTPTTEDMYHEQLNCLPPKRWAGGAFLVGEAYCHTSKGEAVYACFAAINGRYYARYMTVKMFESRPVKDTLPKAA